MAFLPALNGQADHKINFTTVNNIHGLPNNKINDIVKDKLGFIWIATNDGLYRYESSNKGKTCKGNDPAIPNGLQTSAIRALYVDQKDNLWIGTILGGLTRYHIPTDTWTTFQHSSTDSNSISNDEILSIIEDSKGQIWIGTENGLNLFHEESQTFTSFLPTIDKANTLHARAILSITEDDNGFIWIGTWAGGFYLMLPSKDGRVANASFRKFQPATGERAQNVWKIYQDQEKRYWIGTHGSGLYLMDLPLAFNNDPTTQQWEPEFHKIEYEVDKHSIHSNRVQDIFQDQKGNLWLGTVNGLNIATPEVLNDFLVKKKKDEVLQIPFQHYTSQVENPYSITNNIISKIYENDQGIVWLTTYGGISKYNWYTNQFKVYGFPEDVYEMNNMPNIYIGENGLTLMGSEKTGLLQYDRDNKKIKEFEHNHLLLDAFVTAIYSPDRIQLCVGSKDGISLLNMNTLEVANYPLPEKIKASNPELSLNNIANG